MLANRAIYHDGWIASTTPPLAPWLLGLGTMPDVVNGYTWELYNIAEDFSQNNDLAAKMPDKLRDMKELFLVEATKYNVFPLDNDSSSASRRRGQARPPAGPSLPTRVKCPVCPKAAPQHPQQILLHHGRGGNPPGGAEGMLNTLGGRFGGYGLYLLKGKPVFAYNLLAVEHFRWEGPAALRPASTPSRLISNTTALVSARVAPASCRWTARSRQQVDPTHHPVHGDGRTFDVGVDTRMGVADNDYQPPFRFTGKLDKLTIKLLPLKAAEEQHLQQQIQRARNSAQ